MIIGIFAKTDNNLIGLDNSIPWHIKEDLEQFKYLTEGHTVVMGRNTWESIGSKPLKNRLNIIVSSTYCETDNRLVKDFNSPVFSTELEGAIELHNKLNPSKYLFLIGGKILFEKAIKQNIIDDWYITRIPITINADGGTYFDYNPINNGFKRNSVLPIPVKNNIVSHIQVYHFVKEL